VYRTLKPSAVWCSAACDRPSRHAVVSATVADGLGGGDGPRLVCFASGVISSLLGNSRCGRRHGWSGQQGSSSPSWPTSIVAGGEAKEARRRCGARHARELGAAEAVQARVGRPARELVATVGGLPSGAGAEAGRELAAAAGLGKLGNKS
jgi:hypothetical protein